MSTAVVLNHDSSRFTANGLADELITASDAHPWDKIVIAGADQLELLILLLRRGFIDAACLSTALGPTPKRNEADIVITPTIHCEKDLSDVLRRFGCTLRPDGTLVAHMAGSDALSNQCLRSIFPKFGFSVIERLDTRYQADEWWIARRETANDRSCLTMPAMT